MSGKITVVGIGPGNPLDRTKRAELAIYESEVVIGYELYMNYIKDLLDHKIKIVSGMTKEIERCHLAFKAATMGYKVVVVSSGDSGIYGMAGPILEMAENDNYLKIPIEIIPGVSAANAAAASLGAPLMLDWACISLSDLLVDWNVIKTRIRAAAMSDLCIAIYNPKSKKRVKQLEESVDIITKYRSSKTPVGICASIGSFNENVVLTTLGNLCNNNIDMRSIVIIGNKSSVIKNGRFVTPRGYLL